MAVNPQVYSQDGRCKFRHPVLGHEYTIAWTAGSPPVDPAKLLQAVPPALLAALVRTGDDPAANLVAPPAPPSSA